MNLLTQLRDYSTLVADTPDIALIKQYQPTDVTTNPSLILAATGMEHYRTLILESVAQAQRNNQKLAEFIIDYIAVNIGVEILKFIPGRISTEIDTTLSFHCEDSIRKANEIIELYEKAGIAKERVLIKMAATWECIQAAQILEKQGIHCNMTLLFSLPQAVACADAGVTLVSPFVGRVMDWYKTLEGVDSYSPELDPGVKLASGIYSYYKKHRYPTAVMAASFRNIDEIKALAGCDLITIPPQLLQVLEQTQAPLPRALSADAVAIDPIERMPKLKEGPFRWQLNSSAMASEKLAEGIRLFGQDQARLTQYVLSLI